MSIELGGADPRIKFADSTTQSTAFLGYGPAARIYLAAGSALTNSVFTKVPFSAIEYGAADLVNRRIVPDEPGLYYVNTVVSALTDPQSTVARIYKNGAVARNGTHTGLASAADGFVATSASAGLIPMNGTTDYLEVYAYLAKVAGTASLQGGTQATFLEVFWVRPLP